MLSTFFTCTRLSKQRGKPTGVDQRGQHGGGGVATDRQARTNWPALANPLQVPSNSPSAEVRARVPVTGLAISAVGTSCPTSARKWRTAPFGWTCAGTRHVPGALRSRL